MNRHLLLFIILACAFIKCDNKTSREYKNDQTFQFIRKDPEKAIEIYTKAIVENSKDAEAYENRGTAKLMSQDFKGAFDDLSKSIEIEPTTTKYFLRTAYREILGDTAGTILDFDEILKIEPNDSWYYMLRGQVKQQIKDFNGAISDYSKMLVADPKAIGSYFLTGSVKMETGDYSGAILDYTKMIELRPKDFKAYIGRGDAKFRLKNYYGAILDYTAAIEGDPKNAENYYKIGLARIKMGENKIGCLNFKRAVDLGLFEAKEALKKYCQ